MNQAHGPTVRLIFSHARNLTKCKGQINQSIKPCKSAFLGKGSYQSTCAGLGRGAVLSATAAVEKDEILDQSGRDDL